MQIQLKKILEEKHMNRYELAAKTGLSYPGITKIYDGKTKRISLDTIEILCRALDCTPNDLLVFDNENICSDSSDILPHDESNKKDTSKISEP